MQSRNPKFGCVHIAQQISHTFGLDIDKDVVRRVLAQHYRANDSGCDGPSWLTFIAQSKDSLWRVDLLRCESILLRSYISTDHDPLFRFQRWLANLRVLEIDEIKSVSYVPVSHPFVERLISALRREYLDRAFFWNALDLERKLQAFSFSQPQSRSSVAQRGHPGGKAWRASSSPCHACFLRMAAALPRPFPDPNRRLSRNSPSTGRSSGAG